MSVIIKNDLFHLMRLWVVTMSTYEAIRLKFFIKHNNVTVLASGHQVLVDQNVLL